MGLKIWVDADACPRGAKEVLFRCAERTQTEVILVANQYLATPPSKYVSARQVPAGFDVAAVRCAGVLAGPGVAQEQRPGHFVGPGGVAVVLVRSAEDFGGFR